MTLNEFNNEAAKLRQASPSLPVVVEDTDGNPLGMVTEVRLGSSTIGPEDEEEDAIVIVVDEAALDEFRDELARTRKAQES